MVALLASFAVASCAPVPASLAPSGPDASGGAASMLPPTPIPSAEPSPDLTAAPLPGLTWVVRPVPEFTTYGGADLAGSVDGAVRYTHVVASNLEEAWSGFEDASVYLRTADDGETWGQRLLLGGIDPAIAAAEDHVYVALEAYACRSGIGVVVNDQQGRRKDWSAVHCLTTNGKLDSEWAPAIAAAGPSVYVASVDSRTGRAGVWVSGDHGRAWTHTVLGEARPDEDLCCTGAVRLAVAGTQVASMWSDRGTILARLSEDAGGTWGQAVELAGQHSLVEAAATGGLAFGGGGPDGSGWIRVWAPTGWSAVPLPVPVALGAPDTGAVALSLEGGGTQTYLACWIDDGSGEVTVSTASALAMNWTLPAPAPGCGESLMTEDGQVLQVVDGDDEQDYAYALGIGR